MEIEIDRFSIIRTASLKKYTMMAPPEGKLKDKVSVGVDAICTLCLGESTRRKTIVVILLVCLLYVAERASLPW
jgi:hypothetical protein